MVDLILRKQSAQTALKGGTAVWQDDDYSVLDNEDVIGRIYKIQGGPQNDFWRWNLNHLKFYTSPRRDDVVLGGTTPTLDGAKADLKAQYEKWLASRPRPPSQ